jgi:putative peptidoglycan lipid II flippase
VLGEPIVRLLVERGVVTERSTELIAGVLRVFVVGLVPFSLFQLLLRAFYALQDTKTPFYVNCGAVALTTGLNVPLFHLYGVRGLAAGHACGYVAGAVAQDRLLARRLGPHRAGRLLAGAGRTAVAALAMGGVVWLALAGVRSVTEAGTFAATLAEVAVPVTAGGISYLVFARLLRVPELEHVAALVRRRAKPHDRGDTGR